MVNILLISVFQNFFYDFFKFFCRDFRVSLCLPDQLYSLDPVVSRGVYHDQFYGAPKTRPIYNTSSNPAVTRTGDLKDFVLVPLRSSYPSGLSLEVDFFNSFKLYRFQQYQEGNELFFLNYVTQYQLKFPQKEFENMYSPSIFIWHITFF